MSGPLLKLPSAGGVTAFTDDFSSYTTGDDLGTNTTDYTGAGDNFGCELQITAADSCGMDVDGGSGSRFYKYTGSSPSVQNTDHFAEIEVVDPSSTNDSSHNFYLCVRAVDGDNWVAIRFYQNRAINICTRIAGSSTANPTQRTSLGITGIVAGEKFKLEAVGDTVTAYRDTGSGFSSIGSWTDPLLDTGGTFETGAPAIAGYTGGGTYDDLWSVDYFKCGDV